MYMQTGDGELLPQLHLKGVDTEKVVIKFSPKASIIGVCFHPHSVHDIFSISPEELKNNKVDLYCEKEKDLYDLLMQKSTLRDRIQTICKYIYNKILIIHCSEKQRLLYNKWIYFCAKIV